MMSPDYAAPGQMPGPPDGPIAPAMAMARPAIIARLPKLNGLSSRPAVNNANGRNK